MSFCAFANTQHSRRNKMGFYCTMNGCKGLLHQAKEEMLSFSVEQFTNEPF